MSKIQDQDKFIVRLPSGMREKLSKDAKSNNRSMNAEIVARISNSAPEKTLRDEFAMAALNGMASIALDDGDMIMGWRNMSEAAYEAADAMLVARGGDHE